MEYVFNHRPIPIKYDLDLCKQKLTKQFGDIEILVNLLHPENKGGYCSNSDFIFTVIYDDKQNTDYASIIDAFVNNQLFLI